MFKNNQTSSQKENSAEQSHDHSLLLAGTLTIQKLIRANIVQKKYRFFHLSENEKTSYKAFLIGNDPVIEGLDKYAPKNGGVALVATSGFRALLLASILAKNDKTRIPKIFIVDTSKEVHLAWRKLKQFAENNFSEEGFLADISCFLKNERQIYRDFHQYKCDCVDCEPRPEQDTLNFFRELIRSYGYEYERKLITQTTLIQQTFADEETFIKIKNHMENLNINHVFVYPSNILTHIYWTQINHRKLIDPIINNIELLKPMAVIHTNICRKHWEPKSVIIIERQKSTETRLVLGIVPRQRRLITNEESENIRGKNSSVYNSPP